MTGHFGRFHNNSDECNQIISVAREGEWEKSMDLAERLRDKGYDVKDREIAMFIYHNMRYKYFDERRVLTKAVDGKMVPAHKEYRLRSLSSS